MTWEVTCGHCQGDILLESYVATMVCPQCGSLLELPDPEGIIEGPGDTPATAATEEGAIASTASLPSEREQDRPLAEAASSLDAPAMAAVSSAEEHGPAEEHSPPRELSPVPSLPTAEPESAAVAAPWPAEDVSAQATTKVAGWSAATFPVASGETRPAREASGPRGQASVASLAWPAAVPWNWFVIVLSYASAVTIVLLYLWLTEGMRRQHALESLPDLVPEVHNGQVAMKVPPPQANVAPGHVLRLGESQRYGSLKVTPVKVTRGPLQFVHAFQEKGAQRQPTQPVWKLWLRFENVSRDQRFAPLDRTLVYKRIFRRRVFTNNFLCAVDQRREDGQLYYVYDMPEFSEFLVLGQNLGQRVAPGETWETFIPSEEGITEAQGEWVWRVQFRKGYHPVSGRGVTTLIDVHFRAEEIIEEA